MAVILAFNNINIQRMITPELYKVATDEIDKVHSEDAKQETDGEIVYPAELLYSKRMLSILDMVSPGSSYAMKLAVQCQHFQRWGVPRSDYPYDRRGYHQWRRAAMEYQLQLTQALFSRIDMDEEDIQWIVTALREQENKRNPDGRIIMDTECLVFLKWYMTPFSAKHENEKVLDILKKTMLKMSSNGVSLISNLDLPISTKQMLEQATH
jgi:hypothetical protein